MASTTFTSGTVITSAWLNDVNSAVYGGGTGPTKANADGTNATGVWPIGITGNAATATTASTAGTSGKVVTTNFSIEQVGSNLVIKNGATTIVTISPTGLITAG